MSRNKEQDKKKMLAQLHKLPIVEVACKQIGLPRATYYRWLKNDEAFAEACNEAVDQSTGMINDVAESQLIAAIRDRNMSAITFWLKHHHRAYRTKIELDAHISNDQEELTPEQAELIAQALNLAGLSRLPEGESHGAE